MNVDCQNNSKEKLRNFFTSRIFIATLIYSLASIDKQSHLTGSPVIASTTTILTF
jgi:hypothetical protein